MCPPCLAGFFRASLTDGLLFTPSEPPTLDRRRASLWKGEMTSILAVPGPEEETGSEGCWVGQEPRILCGLRGERC